MLSFMLSKILIVVYARLLVATKQYITLSVGWLVRWSIHNIFDSWFIKSD